MSRQQALKIGLSVWKFSHLQLQVEVPNSLVSKNVQAIAMYIATHRSASWVVALVCFVCKWLEMLMFFKISGRNIGQILHVLRGRQSHPGALLYQGWPHVSRANGTSGGSSCRVHRRWDVLLGSESSRLICDISDEHQGHTGTTANAIWKIWICSSFQKPCYWLNFALLCCCAQRSPTCLHVHKTTSTTTPRHCRLWPSGCD